ncbi:MAG TPA: hypothetical protein VF648_14385 [Pyrinomonadaceae bacterium]
MKKRVLVLCTGNSARSQMAEGLLTHIGEGAYEVESGGTKPKPRQTGSNRSFERNRN